MNHATELHPLRVQETNGVLPCSIVNDRGDGGRDTSVAQELVHVGGDERADFDVGESDSRPLELRVETFNFEDDLKQLLHRKDNATMQAFFSAVASAFREEASLLSMEERDIFPHFTTLVDLMDKLPGSSALSAIKTGLLCVYQVARFI